MNELRRLVNISQIIRENKYARISFMSGHSHWSTIQRAKGVADAKRGQTFTQVANNITLAAKLGNSGNPDDNPRLRTVLEEAKAVNMPKENIQRAIDRGLGKLPGQTIEEVLYEGFGPGKVAYLIEAVTDNRMRTLAEVKNLFDKSGGALAGTGAAAFMFKALGEIKVIHPVDGGRGKDEVMLELIDLGAEDVEEFLEENIQRYLVYVDPTQLNTMGTKITQAGYTVESSELTRKPTIFVEIKDKETAEKVIAFTERLEERDDVSKVYANFDITEGLL